MNDNLNCSDIIGKDGFTNCSLYDGGFNGFSCYQSNSFNREFCSVFPDDKNLQRQNVKLLKGALLEIRSIYYQFPNNFNEEDIDFLYTIQTTPDKEIYEKNESNSLLIL